MPEFSVPRPSKESTLKVTVEAGKALYVLGANGSGKSTLLASWAKDGETILVAGNREVVFPAPASNIAPGQAARFEEQAINSVRSDQVRAKKSLANDQHWLDLLLQRLFARTAHYNDQYRLADQAGEEQKKQQLNRAMPTEVLNRAMRAAGLPLSFSLNENFEFVVSKEGVPVSYGMDQMSDGERAAFILIASVILAKENSAILIDEPERHLHRSISSPLLRFLRDERPDLSWVVSTHDLSLPRDDVEAAVLLLYDYNGQYWNAELVENPHELPPEICEAIYGARERVLFVEGTDTSLDRPLYQTFFPGTTIIPVETCHHVQQAVKGLRETGAVHRIEARGIVDGDNRLANDIETLLEQGVHTLGVYSVEAVYYHPLVIEAVQKLMDPEATTDKVIASACDALDGSISKACKDAAYKAFRERFHKMLPTPEEFLDAENLTIEVNGRGQVEELTERVNGYRERGEWIELLKMINIRTTSAPNAIVGKLGYRNRKAYERVALQRLRSEDSLREQLVREGVIPDPFIEPGAG